MPMSNGDACDINIVLNHALGMPDVTGTIPPAAEAQQAASRLADRASKVLGAGLYGSLVHAAWPEDNETAARAGAEDHTAGPGANDDEVQP